MTVKSMDTNKAIKLIEHYRELKISQGDWLLNDEDVSEALKMVLEMAKGVLAPDREAGSKEKHK
jgi:hypothetical protein